MGLLIVKLALFVLVVHTYTTVAYDDVNQTKTFDIDLPDDTLFKPFKITHERKYKNISVEEKLRNIFVNNVKKIRNHNAKYAKGESTYALGINQFTDQTDDGECFARKKKFKATVQSYMNVLPGEQNLQKAVAYNGPVAVAVFACDHFMGYEKGVLNRRDCATSNLNDLDHIVLVVGYGHDYKENLDYWLVKNSYGTTWGDEGYIKIARNKKQHVWHFIGCIIVEPFASYASTNNGPKNINAVVSFMLIAMSELLIAVEHVQVKVLTGDVTEYVSSLGIFLAILDKTSYHL